MGIFLPDLNVKDIPVVLIKIRESSHVTHYRISFQASDALKHPVWNRVSMESHLAHS